ncbi:TPR domain protein, putative component of TonB system [Enhygromyxa salina]|uniref:TPR domain protein, putative component of TonB system n=1 Tax=Enhygromyxa salina TaxID=215803 RepID=A0A0C2CTN1_9BACT|nr:tetratricopeptide repeat protein [Enhygromyxa salina]KIG12980.1 TPR domain protein, putative component of TonB system [Enhygromyxa salina]
MPADATNWRNLQATEQLVVEFAAGRFDSVLARRIIANAPTFSMLLRASFLAERGQLARARADIDAALARGGDNPVIELVAGQLLFVTHDYQRALDQFARAGARPGPAGRRGRQQVISAALALGWKHDVREWLERSIAEDPDHPSLHAQAVRFYSRGHWPERALEHARPALAQTPDSPSLWMEVSTLHAALDQREQAIAAAERALELAPVDQRLAYTREAGRVAIDAGRFDLAQAWFAEALLLDPAQTDVHVWLGEIAAWSDQREQAREQAERALALQPECGPALRLLGGLAVATRAWDRARELLGRAVAIEHRDYQAHAWLSELHLRTGAHELAHAHLQHATTGADGFLLGAWLLRFLLVASEEPRSDEPVVPNRTEEFEHALPELVPELAALALRTRARADMIAAVEGALAALRGNRSVHPTHLVEGELRRLHAGPGCRQRSRSALQLLGVARPAHCLEVFDAVERAYPGSSLPVCHRGELHLWLGNWDAARADLELAIERVTGTRWAYMGLSTLDLLAGQPSQALATNARGVEVMRGTEGPAIHVFRGEALRMLGRIDEAIIELERAVAAHPARVGATINLALAYAAKRDSASLNPLWDRLTIEQAPGLMSDAARERAEVIVADGAWRPGVEVMVRVLERALEMLGGNRSSGLLTYWTKERELRFVRLWPNDSGGVHARDHLRIARAKQLLLKALASYRRA